MQIEAQPQTNLKNQVSKENSVVSAYQSVNSKMASIKTAAEALTSTTNWQAAKVSSSSTSVTATASAGAAAGTTTFDVKSLVTTHVMTAAVPDVQVTLGNGLDFTNNADGSVQHVDAGDDTPQGLADAINSADIGIKAAVVTTDHGTVLQMTSTKPGAAGSFSVDGFANAPAQVAVQGADAQIQFGDPAAGGYTISSSSNT